VQPVKSSIAASIKDIARTLMVRFPSMLKREAA
jgi:hypothetical protein